MTGPHQGQPVETAGAPIEEAEAAVVLVHGRGAAATSILGMAAELDQSGVAYLAPQAAGNTWYPESFLRPVEHNEPGRSSGLQALADAVAVATDAGIPTERVLVVGFSQGACLAAEYVARHPTRYGGLGALSGGLIGEQVDPDEYEGDLKRTPAFFGCSTVDPHIPEQRVHESASVFSALGADVEKRLYEGLGHGVNADELEYISGMIAALLA